MELIFSVKFWLVVGLILLIIEIFSGSFIALSFGIAGFLMAGLLKIFPVLLIEWYEVVFAYSAVSLLIVPITRIIILKSKAVKPDIND